MKVAIIGSFQKFYDEISQMIVLLRKEGFTVTSPYLSTICASRNAFVVFDADDATQTNDEIQTETLRKILNADVVYVYNTQGGYVGKTTSFEIGFLMSKKKPLYFKEIPDDLPIPVATSHVLSPEDFIQTLKEKKIYFEMPIKEISKNQSDIEFVYGERPKLVVCGSMKYYEKMIKVKNDLVNKGIFTIVPNDEELKENISEEKFNEYKKKVSRDYLKTIRSKGTYAVLVINEDKNGKENYIGANTFVEIAMAFSWNRKIYLYNDIYEPYRDELIGWDVISLKRDLSLIEKDFCQIPNGIIENEEKEEREIKQLTFNDYMDDELRGYENI